MTASNAGAATGLMKGFILALTSSCRFCCVHVILPRIGGPSPQPSPTGRGSQFGLIAPPLALLIFCFANVIMPRIGLSPQPSPKGRGSQFGLIAPPLCCNLLLAPSPLGRGLG